jgi:hypothetical protein
MAISGKPLSKCLNKTKLAAPRNNPIAKAMRRVGSQRVMINAHVVPRKWRSFVKGFSCWFR